MSNIGVIGSGFSGLSAATHAASQGHKVHLFEKNASIGGRARAYSANGFFFDMGPSWYWMPDVFENYFNAFGKSAANYYNLIKLDPGFQIFFAGDEVMQIPASLNDIYQLFEQIEKGSATQLKRYLADAEFKYHISMSDLVHQPALSVFEFMKPAIIKNALKTNLFTSLSKYVRRHFKDERLIALMEFPVLFLGAMANKIPALYSIMNYSALVQGTYYPMGGMHEIVNAMQQLAQEKGVNIITDFEIDKINTHNNKVISVSSKNNQFQLDALIAGADYHHVESLLPSKQRNYTQAYWQSRTFAPSALIFYVGVNKVIPKLIHHNLFFDTDMNTHANEIYTDPAWPSNPLFYVCCPSKTDAAVAPAGMENLFILIPLATGLPDTNELREAYFTKIMQRIEKRCGTSITNHIVYKKSYCLNNFISDYHAYKGNAYGLANTLKQTAILKPAIKNKKVENLFYTGQLTVPGPGVPPALISGGIAAKLTNNYLKKSKI